MPNEPTDDFEASVNNLIARATEIAVQEIVLWLRTQAVPISIHSRDFCLALTWAADKIAAGEPWKGKNKEITKGDANAGNR